MKYTIFGFSQQGLLDLDFGLKEAAILRFIVDFKATGEMKSKSFNGNEYFWLLHDYIINEIPILKVKKQALVLILKKMVTSGLIEKKLEKTKSGTYTYYRIVRNVYIDLISTTNRKRQVLPTNKNLSVLQARPTNKNLLPKDPSIINSSINQGIVTKKKKIKKKIIIPSLPPAFETAEFKLALEGYLEMRITKKAPPTTHALTLIFKKLIRFSGNKVDTAIEILNQSVIKNYTDVYEIKSWGRQSNEFDIGKLPEEVRKNLASFGKAN